MLFDSNPATTILFLHISHMIIPLFAMGVVLFLRIILPQRWQKNTQSHHTNLPIGSRITTINGLHGIIRSQSGDFIIMAGDDGSNIEININSIARPENGYHTTAQKKITRFLSPLISRFHNVHYTPLLGPLGAVVVGIYLHAQMPLPWVVLVCGSIGALLSTLGAARRHNQRLIAASVCVFLYCMSALTLTLHKKEQTTLLSLLANKPITLTATIIDKDYWGPQVTNEVLRLKTIKIMTPDNHVHDISCDILCYLRRKTQYAVGDTIMLTSVTLKPAPTATINGNPSYSDYLLKEHIIGSLFLPTIRPLSRIHHPHHSMRFWLWNLRHTTYKNCMHNLSPTAAAYMGLIFFGNKQQKNIETMRTVFNYWGLAHYLARAGLHIILFIMIWTFILGLMPIHITFKRWILILLCILYDMMSWSSIPFTRAYYAFLIMESGKVWRQTTNSLHILTLMCLCILLFNPLQLFFLDFQLTFGLTFALILFSGLITKKST
jgi:predicted membrane metal-binding protein/preprotein translocase subunit YajC